MSTSDRMNTSARRRGGVRVLGGTALVAVAVVLAVRPARAETPATSGYWWKGTSGGLPTPAPAVPDNGLWVASDPSGPLAVSAVRAAGDGRLAGLRLTVDQVAGTALVWACPAQPGWAAGGAWEERVVARCDVGRVDGAVAGGAVTFDLTRLAGLIANDVALVPADGAAPFSLTLAAPGPDAVTTEAVPAPQPAVPAAAETRSPAPAPTGPTVDAAPFTPSPLGNSALPYGAEPQPLDTGRPGPEAAAGGSRGGPISTGPGVATARTRAPAALLLAGLVLAVWGWRARAAVAAAATHPLAKPLRAASDAIVDAEAFLAGDAPGAMP